MALGAQDELLAGRYRRLSVLGVGGMAKVYLAEDERLGRQVAVKRLHADSPEDAALRLEREAKLGASLNHPNLVSVYDVVSEGESVLIVMEHVDGETLQEMIRRGPVAPNRVARLVADVAAGLDHAHSHAVIHRDVKPANILVRRDEMAKLADLGIASAAERTSITRSGIVLGTASYMAPEQLDGGTAGPRTDVYALAAVAYEALAGEKARTGRNPVEVAHEIVNGPPRDVRELWRDAPAAAADTLTRGMARDPADRPQSAGALARELEQALGRRPRLVPTPVTAATRAVPPTVAPPLLDRSRLRRRRRWVPAAIVASLLAVSAIAGIAAMSGEDGSPQERTARQGASANSSDSGSRAADDTAGEETEPTPAPTQEPPREAAPEPTTDDPVALNAQGFQLMQAGEYEQAIPLLERAVSQYPEGSQELNYAYALYNLGRSLRLAGRADEAVPILERRLAIPNQTSTVRQELQAARAEAG
jgi:serine/threonine protein kinase